MRRWLKLYTEILQDPKMWSLSDSAFRVCINLFAVAGWVDDENGRLGDIQSLCLHLRSKPSRLQPALDKLQACGILAEKDGVYFAAHWTQRNRVAPADLPSAVRQRVAKSRENGKKSDNVTRYSDKAPKNVTAQNRIEEKRIDKNTGATAPAREPDPLFDAIVEVCQVDPKTTGPSIGKVKAVLLKANPPYTPEEVRSFGKGWWSWDKRTDPPSLWNLQEKIGKVRAVAPTNGHSAAAQLRAEGYTDADGNPV